VLEDATPVAAGAGESWGSVQRFDKTSAIDRRRGTAAYLAMRKFGQARMAGLVAELVRLLTGRQVHCDGPDRPSVQPSGARSWVLRLSVAGKRREMGLGGFPDVTLADARHRAREERERADKGVDPIAERKAAANLLLADMAKALTFKSAALAYIEAHEPSWRNAKHGEQRDFDG